MLGRELRRIAKRAPLTLRLMLRAFNPHAREDSHGVTEAQRRFTAGALPQTPKAGQSQAIDWRQIIFYTLHGQTYDLKIEPPMLCVSVTLCETPLPACGWRVRGGSETVVKRHLRAVGVPVSSAGARKWVNSSFKEELFHDEKKDVARAVGGRLPVGGSLPWNGAGRRVRCVDGIRDALGKWHDGN